MKAILRRLMLKIGSQNMKHKEIYSFLDSGSSSESDFVKINSRSRKFLTNIYLAMLFFCVSLSRVWAYKAVYLIHGIAANSSNFDLMSARIKQLHPGTETFATDLFSLGDSDRPMMEQVNGFKDEFLSFSNNHTDGFHVIGYSQGGLIGRALIETYPEHNVNTFISISVPHGGQYGGPFKFKYIKFPNVSITAAYSVMYSRNMQKQFSLSNYWNDPYHQDLYLKYSTFLPYIDNIKPSNLSENYKRGFSKLKKLVLIGGPDDSIIIPWQSCHFAIFNTDGKLVRFQDRDVYKEDSFGLKTLHLANRITTYEVDGIHHTQWLNNMAFIDEYVVSNLD